MKRYRDGPLSFRPPEEIRYGTGQCALGPILVAAGDKGIVTIMIRDKAGALLREIRAGFPKATLVRDEKGCKPLVAKVIRYIAAPFKPFDLPLDLRGTEFQQRVWREVQKIPCGQVSTYAQIASAIGAPKAVRAVASSCTRCRHAFAVPCHRVLHGAGASAARRDPQHRRRYRWADYEAGLRK
jgi:AraC family transcriptional regulator of adaptative response/methylated-DNA-[protein]-cysteine methyltransferase